MSRDDDLREALNQVAEEFYRYDSNPSTWLAYLVYLMEKLQEKATEVNPVNSSLYGEMISKLLEAIRNRQKTGGW